MLVAPRLSREVSEALIALGAGGRIFRSPISRTAYHLSTASFWTCRSPTSRAPAASPPGFLAAFNSPQVYRSVVEAIRLMGGVGLESGISDHDSGTRLYKIHSDLHCEKCGRCCTTSNPISLEPQDVERLSAHLGISIRKTIQKYTTPVEVEGQRAWSMKNAKPCAFLDEAKGLCKIHPARPIVFRAFPLLSPRIVGGERPTYSCPTSGSLKKSSADR